MCRVHGPLARCECGYAAEWAVGLAAFALGTACSLFAPAEAPEADPCMAEIAKLEGMRNAEIVAACAGQDFDDCAAVDAIDRKYEPFIQAAIRCEP